MRHFILCTIVLFFNISQEIKAQYGTPVGSRSLSLGGASVTLTDPFSVSNNQAGMAFIEKSSLAICYENPFLLKELSKKALLLSLKTRYGNLGMTLLQTGNSDYNTLFTGIAYSRRLGRQIACGIQCDLLRTHLSDGYGQRYIPSCELGLIMFVKENLLFGVHIFNPVRSLLSPAFHERVPTIMKSGLKYIFSSQLSLLVEVSKNTHQPMQFHSGIEYSPVKSISARMGYGSLPNRYSFGFGFQKGTYDINLTGCYHETLGFSPNASISYSF
ncbi:MAG: hypothetical protein IPH84_15785 [Bacteroidales bacterium]|nr:hypothetical protein [Bacteroidales bacterium]